ncbi:hypothetical protein HGI30_00485 [Paenibacillus albicereus]|uniref:PpiC domain-containing protein n=1 Tax=Paenibacillus albicereus TaxID=2726185 RepID=A0A6H2GS45_9BACL|nr:peptidylprolyl isomerase [Paenibacillus albicereus]QJC50234.1 hypothetical protein HGI30_00485 [Paenibacillus albicereus]
MGRNKALKTIIGLQAVCMIVMAAFVLAERLQGEPILVPAQAQVDESVQGEDGAAAVVGSERITESELGARLRDQYGESVLQTMMIRSALDQESARGGLAVTEAEIEAELQAQMEGYGDEEGFYREMASQFGLSRDEVYEEAMYRLLLEKWMTKGIAVSDAQVEAYLQEHEAELRPAPRAHLRWIVSASRDEAQSLLGQLEAGGDFAELARMYSLDEATAELGGDLGVVEEGDPFLDPGAAAAASSLAEGEIGGPAEVAGGYALVQVLERESPLALDEQVLRSKVRRLIALDEAGSTKEGEQRLLRQYGARIGGDASPQPAPSASG